MGRRAAELVGVLVATVLSSYVTTQALAGPQESALYVIGAAVPLAMLVIYWLWVEPRAEAERIRAKRLQQALEDAIELEYRNDPDRDPAEAATAVTGAPDAERREWYTRLNIADMYEPNHTSVASVLQLRAETARDLLRRINEDPDTIARDATLDDELDSWEELTIRDLEGARRHSDVLSFRDPTLGQARDVASRRKRLEQQLWQLEGWINQEHKRARDQAKRRFE
jgi:hypothetical protein